MSERSWKQHLHEWTTAKNLVMVRAIRARENGVSHRNFKVGAAALVWDRRGNAYDILEGANHKPQKGLGPRVCAEEEIMAVAQLKGYQIIGFAIAGDYQPDDATHTPFKALVPCVECRKKLRSFMAEQVEPHRDMPFVSIRIENDEVKEEPFSFTYEQLMRQAPIPANGDETIEVPRAIRP